MRKIHLLIAYFYSGLANASWFGVATYEDCVLKHLPTAKTESAANMVEEMCRAKFPEKELKKELAKCEGKMIDGNIKGRFEVELPHKPRSGVEASAKMIEFSRRTMNNVEGLDVRAEIDAPFYVDGIKIATYDRRNRLIGEFDCYGKKVWNAVGSFHCPGAADSAQQVAIKTLVTAEATRMDLLKRLKICQ